jgi:ABC-2 type transport system permease protein
MSARVTLATAARVLAQLRRDPRTVALLLVVPPTLLTLLRYMFDLQQASFDRIAPPVLGIFPLVTLFLVTSITVLRERTTGTLERLMTMPLSKLDLLAGYALAFGLLGAAQAALTSAVAFGLLGVEVSGSPLLVAVLAVGNALLGMSLGLLVSAFAATEFQAVQFMPALILPQLLLCGLFVPRDRMAQPLEAAASALPLTYAFDALSEAARAGTNAPGFWADAAVLAGSTLLAIALGAATLRRRTA